MTESATAVYLVLLGAPSPLWRLSGAPTDGQLLSFDTVNNLIIPVTAGGVGVYQPLNTGLLELAAIHDAEAVTGFVQYSPFGGGFIVTPAGIALAWGQINGMLSNQTDLQSALNVKADLVGGVIPTAQIPAIALTEYLGQVASEVVMLALVGQKADWCIRTDTGSVWVITGPDPTLIGDWTELEYPAAPVTSVNGQTGLVVLDFVDDADPRLSDARQVAVVDAAADITTWLMLATSQTGNQAPVTDSALIYDAGSNVFKVISPTGIYNTYTDGRYLYHGLGFANPGLGLRTHTDTSSKRGIILFNGATDGFVAIHGDTGENNGIQVFGSTYPSLEGMVRVITSGVERLRVTNAGWFLFTGQITHVLTLQSPVGTTVTVTWTVGNNQHINLSGASGDVTVSYVAPSGPCDLTLKITQGATARDINWPAPMKFNDEDGERVWNLDTSKVVIAKMYFDGTTYHVLSTKVFT